MRTPKNEAMKARIDDLAATISDEVEAGRLRCRTWAVFVFDGKGGTTVFDGGCACEDCMKAIASAAAKHTAAIAAEKNTTVH